MTGRQNRGLLESVLSAVDATLDNRKRLADVVLMVALADAFVENTELERVSESIGSYAEYEGVDFNYIYQRIEELQLTAPLFSEERQQLVRDLTDPRARRLALSLAAKMVGGTQGLAEEQTAMLHGLADAFKIPEMERGVLFAPWAPWQMFGDSIDYLKCRFNSCDRLDKLSLFDAMAQADNHIDFKLLTHKVSASRYLLNKLFEGAEIVSLAEIIRCGPFAFHADTIIEHTVATQQIVGYQRYLARFLAPGEGLHTLEHSVIQTLVHKLDESAHVLIVHTSDLHPKDRVFLEGFDPNLVRGEQIDV